MPSNLDLDPMFDNSPRARLVRFVRRVINTRYLFIALLIHVVALALFGGKVIFDAIQSKGAFESEGDVLVAGTPGPPPPPPSPMQEQKFDVKVNKEPVKMTTRIATPRLSQDFNLPPPDVQVTVSEGLEVKVDDSARQRMAQAETARWTQVRNFQEGGVIGQGGKKGVTGSGKQTVAKFTCYVVKYQGGDWDANFGATDGTRWYGNCIYNLMLQIGRWTQNKIKAELVPTALTLSDPEWLEKVKPPFIFMTGHKNFTFSDKEVENLRQYLMLGGALWVDNALPGRCSRFDIALRRELKRVVPDQDFEALAPGHPLFNAYYQFQAPPAGMNAYREPVEVIKIGGEVAVVYTLNAYSDLWETLLDEKDQVEVKLGWSPKLQRYFTPYGPHWNNNWHPYTKFFFRNVNRDSVVNAYKFGINITVYLLTRFQDKFMTLSH